MTQTLHSLCLSTIMASGVFKILSTLYKWSDCSIFLLFEFKFLCVMHDDPVMKLKVFKDTNSSRLTLG